MIKLDISLVLFFYLFFTVIGVLLLWIFLDLRTKRQLLRKDEDYIRHCSICAHVYIDSKNNNISRCPLCGSYNEKQKREKSPSPPDASRSGSGRFA